jgi:dihydropyrimidine dehydrogenase (NAD+) subunit PreT
VPAFIQKISTGNLLGSARVILSANILGHSCGRVCPTEVLCEGACVMHEKGESRLRLAACSATRSITLLAARCELFLPGAPNGKRVACIGAGPASLACAAELAKWGYDVTIFDRNELPGGLNTYGIAAYKTRAADAIRETELCQAAGSEIPAETEVGRDVFFADLESSSTPFSSAWAWARRGNSSSRRGPARRLRRDGVHREDKVQRFTRSKLAARVACIGAGNTAIDVVTAARRLGAEAVYLIYRRGEPEMPAFAYEYQLAKQDASFFCGRRSRCACSGERRRHWPECVRTHLGAPDAKGRRTPELSGQRVHARRRYGRARGGPKAGDRFLRGEAASTQQERHGKVNGGHQTGNPKYFAGGRLHQRRERSRGRGCRRHGGGARRGRLARCSARGSISRG